MTKNYFSAFSETLKEEGARGTIKKAAGKLSHAFGENPGTKNRIRILLLTNRDSDNLGDQTIELCDIALIQAAMKNLHVPKSGYQIVSRAAGMITKKYLREKDPDLLKPAEQEIENCDVLIFGGAPLLDFTQSVFSKRTVITLELAQKHKVPVIFSAVGLNGYEEENPKCRSLKRALNFSCVKQITTRDDLDALLKFVEDDTIVRGRVADPAVFAAEVYRKIAPRPSQKPSGSGKKKIGIFILRPDAFERNNIDVSAKEAAAFWISIIDAVKERGYDYQLLTSGFFMDETFLEDLTDNYGIDPGKCVFNLNTPDDLIKRMASFDGVISGRLHPGIISYSMGIPAVNLVWNPKVEYFYQEIGQEKRALHVREITPEIVMDTLQEAMDHGISRDPSYVMSVYETLYEGLCSTLFPGEKKDPPFDFDQLCDNIPAFEGTTKKEKDEKIRRKFKRTYQKFNKLRKA